jgi:hypothetical protein
VSLRDTARAMSHIDPDMAVEVFVLAPLPEDDGQG